MLTCKSCWVGLSLRNLHTSRSQHFCDIEVLRVFQTLVYKCTAGPFQAYRAALQADTDQENKFIEVQAKLGPATRPNGMYLLIMPNLQIRIDSVNKHASSFADHKAKWHMLPSHTPAWKAKHSQGQHVTTLYDPSLFCLCCQALKHPE